MLRSRTTESKLVFALDIFARSCKLVCIYSYVAYKFGVLFREVAADPDRCQPAAPIPFIVQHQAHPSNIMKWTTIENYVVQCPPCP